MKELSISQDDLQGVFAVPPLARTPGKGTIDFVQNESIVNHIRQGGITRLIYGGNAFLYHIRLREFEELIEWLSDIEDLTVIPSIGPSYGRAVDQATVLKKHRFPCAMVLPCGDPRDVSGLETGYREIADAGSAKLLLYIKDETNFGSEKQAGLDAVARLVDDGVCAGIKYAAVRADPSKDSYLESLLARVDRRFVISGIGERPAVVHLRNWKLPGFTTGSGCIAPRLSQSLFEACARGDFELAGTLREKFIALEDLRDTWGPARVLHHAVESAGIARTGPITPYVSSLSESQLAELEPVVKELVNRES